MKIITKNIETEMQLKILSREEMIKNLLRIGFKVSSKSSIKDYYYTKNGKFSVKHPYFRVRENNNELELTFKKNVETGDVKIRKEIILRVDSLNNSLEFLEAIGLKRVIVKMMEVVTFKRNKDLVEIIKTSKPSKFEFAEIESEDCSTITCILEELGDSVALLSESDFPKI